MVMTEIRTTEVCSTIELMLAATIYKSRIINIHKSFYVSSSNNFDD